MRKIVFQYVLILVSSQILGLQISNQITVCNPDFDANNLHISANSKGEAVLSWISDSYGQRFEISRISPGCARSEPEHLSDLEYFIRYANCMIDENGYLSAAWQVCDEDDHTADHLAKSVEAGKWIFRKDWTSPETNLHRYKTALDGEGNLCLFGIKDDTFSTLDPYTFCITTNTDSDDKAEVTTNLKRLISLDTPGVCFSKNGKGFAYFSWDQNNKYYLACQEIISPALITSPKTICRLSWEPDHLRGAINDRGDMALASHDNYGEIALIAAEQNVWGKPFVFSSHSGSSTDVDISIECDSFNDIDIFLDDSGNALAAWGAKRNSASFLEMVYKPQGAEWNEIISFPIADRSCYGVSSAIVKSDGSGNFVILWEICSGERSDILGSVFSTAKQTYTKPAKLFKVGRCSQPALTFWSPGKGYIAWKEEGVGTKIQAAEITSY